MRVLVTWGSRYGGTEGIGHILAEALREAGFDVVALPAGEVRNLEGFEAVIAGGGLYANRWSSSARRFVSRHVERLRQLPVWLFSSGPLDDSADRAAIPATTQVAVLAERIGARGHVTFGGRLEPDVEGFPAKAIAQKSSGDWRNPDRIRAWAAELARELPTACPGKPLDHAARSWPRLAAYAAAGWALCAATMAAMLAVADPTLAMVVHALVAPILSVALARRYFGARGARDPLPAAFAWTAIVALLDLAIVAGVVQGSLEMFASFAGTWLPMASIFLAVWLTGLTMSTLPWPKPAATPSQ